MPRFDRCLRRYRPLALRLLAEGLRLVLGFTRIRHRSVGFFCRPLPDSLADPFYRLLGLVATLQDLGCTLILTVCSLL